MKEIRRFSAVLLEQALDSGEIRWLIVDLKTGEIVMEKGGNDNVFRVYG